MTEPLLRIDGLDAGYGRSQVLRGVDLQVWAGEMVAIIGANGAGKSTLLRAVVGLIGAMAGTVRFDGRDVVGWSPERMLRAGVSLVPEGRMLFGPMTVRENLELGAYSAGRRRKGAVESGLARVHSLFPVLEERAHQRASTLSGGEQQMLAVARGLMSGPRVLLLDEPSLGLAPKVIAEIFAVLDALKAEGLTVILVEQDARLALRHADRGYVMSTGRVVMQGPARELAANEGISRIYLGSTGIDVHPESTGSGPSVSE